MPPFSSGDGESDTPKNAEESSRIPVAQRQRPFLARHGTHDGSESDISNGSGDESIEAWTPATGGEDFAGKLNSADWQALERLVKEFDSENGPTVYNSEDYRLALLRLNLTRNSTWERALMHLGNNLSVERRGQTISWAARLKLFRKRYYKVVAQMQQEDQLSRSLKAFDLARKRRWFGCMQTCSENATRNLANQFLYQNRFTVAPLFRHWRYLASSVKVQETEASRSYSVALQRRFFRDWITESHGRQWAARRFLKKYWERWRTNRENVTGDSTRAIEMDDARLVKSAIYRWMLATKSILLRDNMLATRYIDIWHRKTDHIHQASEKATCIANSWCVGTCFADWRRKCDAVLESDIDAADWNATNELRSGLEAWQYATQRALLSAPILEKRSTSLMRRCFDTWRRKTSEIMRAHTQCDRNLERKVLETLKLQARLRSLVSARELDAARNTFDMWRLATTSSILVASRDGEILRKAFSRWRQKAQFCVNQLQQSFQDVSRTAAACSKHKVLRLWSARLMQVEASERSANMIFSAQIRKDAMMMLLEAYLQRLDLSVRAGEMYCSRLLSQTLMKWRSAAMDRCLAKLESVASRIISRSQKRLLERVFSAWQARLREVEQIEDYGRKMASAAFFRMALPKVNYIQDLRSQSEELDKIRRLSNGLRDFQTSYENVVDMSERFKALQAKKNALLAKRILRNWHRATVRIAARNQEAVDMSDRSRAFVFRKMFRTWRYKAMINTGNIAKLQDSSYYTSLSPEVYSTPQRSGRKKPLSTVERWRNAGEHPFTSTTPRRLFS